jgi:hypothetical protein
LGVELAHFYRVVKAVPGEDAAGEGRADAEEGLETGEEGAAVWEIAGEEEDLWADV